MFKIAGVNDHEKAAKLLEGIRAENPAHWPHGLTVGHFRAGNLWLLQKSASEDPFGFVGWQSYHEGPEKVGCYSIGLLPEFRGLGLAKAAVSRLLQEKAATVDKVVAYISPGNAPSERLAQSLGVQIHKQAGLGDIIKAVGRFGAAPAAGKVNTQALKNWGATLGTPLVMDGLSYGRHGLDEWGENFSPGRLINAGLNAGIGRWAMTAPTSGEAFGRMLGAPAKDLMLSAVGTSEAVQSAANRFQGGAAPQAPDVNVTAGGESKSNLLPALLLGGLGLGGAGLIGHMLRKQEDQGRMKVTLPTKNPNDVETTLDLPIGQRKILTPSMEQKLDRDARRRLYSEFNARTARRGRSAEENDMTAVS